jgi:hypothetical protein
MNVLTQQSLKTEHINVYTIITGFGKGRTRKRDSYKYVLPDLTINILKKAK